MRVILTDDHPMVRDAFRIYLERLAPEAEVLIASTLEESLTIAQTQQNIDIIVLDLRMPGVAGLDGLKRVRAQCPNVPVVLMSGNARPEEIQAALDMGARGYFPKTLSGPALVNALRLVMAGETFVPYGTFLAPPSPPPSPAKAQVSTEAEDGSNLTTRERDVLPLLEQGLSNKEIARRLNVQEVTVKLHVRGICRKLGAKNRTQAAMRSVSLRKAQLATPPDPCARQDLM